MLLKEFIRDFNSRNNGFTVGVIVDEDSNSDMPKALYTISYNDKVIGTYNSSTIVRSVVDAYKTFFNEAPSIEEFENNMDNNPEVLEENEIENYLIEVEEHVEEEDIEELHSKRKLGD